MKKSKSSQEHPVRFFIDQRMPNYWPPRSNVFWHHILKPMRKMYSRYIWHIKKIGTSNITDVFKNIDPQDGVLITPNHSHEADPNIVIEACSDISRRPYFMAAWQTFRYLRGLSGWFLQHLGAFSVDRDGNDRTAIKEAIQILTHGRVLTIFPEGEIHRLNEKLNPLFDGVLYIALSAQRELIKANSPRRIWVLPSYIRYTLAGDVSLHLERQMTRLERHLVWWTPPRSGSMKDRIINFGEALLTLKEKDKLGKVQEGLPLPERIANLMEHLLNRHEITYCAKSPVAATIPLRVKAIRKKILVLTEDEEVTIQSGEDHQQALDDVQLVLQLLSYPGDYISEQPSFERMMETVEKYCEDIFSEHRPIAKRNAQIYFGDPIDIRKEFEDNHQSVKKCLDPLNEILDQRIKALIKNRGQDFKE